MGIYGFKLWLYMCVMLLCNVNKFRKCVYEVNIIGKGSFNFVYWWYGFIYWVFFDCFLVFYIFII